MRWRLLPWALCACVLAFPCAAGAKDKVAIAKVKVPGDDPALVARIHTAIDRGARWLLTIQRKDGSFSQRRQGPANPMMPPTRYAFGETALATLTLAHCGYPADHPVIKRALAFLRKHYRSQMTGDFLPQASAYGLSLYVLALDELFGMPARARAMEAKSRYAAPKARKSNPCAYPAWVRKTLRLVIDWMLEKRSSRGLFRYPGGLPGPPPGMPPGMPQGAPPGGARMTGDVAGPEDLSNTQYVLLALWVGSRCGVRIPPKVAQSIGMRLLAMQELRGPEVVRGLDPDPVKSSGRYAEQTLRPPGPTDHARGFPYVPGGLASGSMSAAGLSSLLIVKGMLQEQGALSKPFAKLLDRGIWDGIAWLSINHDPRINPRNGPMWHFYYLYGLERAMVIAKKRYLGTVAWYPQGARLLCDMQEKSGRWAPAGGGHGGPGGMAQTPLWDTCFALLFLTRATVTPTEPVLDTPRVTTPSAK